MSSKTENSPKRAVPTRPVIIDPSFLFQSEGAHRALFAISIVSKIFSYLTVVELLRAQRTCKFWKMVVNGRLLLRRQPQMLLVQDLCNEHSFGVAYNPLLLTSEHWFNTDIRPLLKNVPRTCISFHSAMLSEYKSFYLLNHFFMRCKDCFYYRDQLPRLNCLCLLSVDYAMFEFRGEHDPISILLLPELKVSISITPLSYNWATHYTRIDSKIPKCVLDLFCPKSPTSPNQCLILFEHEFSDALDLNYAESDHDFYTFKCNLFKEFRSRFRKNDALWGGKIPFVRRASSPKAPIFTLIQIVGVNVCFYSLILKWDSTTYEQRRQRICNFRDRIPLKANSMGLHLYHNEISKSLYDIMIGKFFPTTPFLHISIQKHSNKDNNRENLFSMNSFEDPKHQVMKYTEMYSAVLVITYN